MKLHTPGILLNPQQCEEIIQLAHAQGFEPNSNSPDIRTNTVSWIEPPEWLYVLMWEVTAKRTLNIPTVTWLQPFQVSRYGVGESYDWHQDLVDTRSWRKSKRTATVTVTLQSAEGAGVEIQDLGVVCRDQGEAVMFRATDQHRALAPKRGERYALTVWCMGPNL